MEQIVGHTCTRASVCTHAFFAGGYFASRLGGRRVLPVGLGTWSAGTALAALTGTVQALGATRCVGGDGGGRSGCSGRC
eukprot:243945-Chlamydomonas_euryale.AAC.2